MADTWVGVVAKEAGERMAVFRMLGLDWVARKQERNK
jgi:hypothetical protein